MDSKDIYVKIFILGFWFHCNRYLSLLTTSTCSVSGVTGACTSAVTVSVVPPYCSSSCSHSESFYRSCSSTAGSSKMSQRSTSSPSSFSPLENSSAEKVKNKIVNYSQIWSGDKTGVYNVPKEEKFLGEVNKPLYNQMPADQSETMTVLTFVNAVDQVCPPMVIYKGNSVKRNFG